MSEAYPDVAWSDRLVINGALTVKLPDSDTWTTYGAGEQFTVAANSRFNVKIERDTAYLCAYR